MQDLEGCQIPNLQKLSEGLVKEGNQPLLRKIKRTLAVPWNYHVKRLLKKIYRFYSNHNSSRLSINDLKPQPTAIDNTYLEQADRLRAGDWVRVRSWEEIQPFLDPFKETRGCAFLEEMRQYCDTNQCVLKSMERFLDERDYKVKKVNGIILLENVICTGTPAFGKCDRCCFLFWREEWLEKITT